MTNSDQDGIVREVINSIAQVYNWEGFYRPVHKTVVTVPEDTLIRYRGDYALGETNISITKKDKALYLSINGGSPMHLFFSSPTDFFLMEIPASVRFEKNASGNHYDIILKDGGKDVRIIKK